MYQRLLLAQGVKKVSIVCKDEHEPHIERHHKTIEEMHCELRR